jgi:hypothetical protein
MPDSMTQPRGPRIPFDQLVRQSGHDSEARREGNQTIAMNTLDRKGITLAYQEAGSGTSPVLLVHGFGCDHTFLLPQLRFLGDRRRTVTVDLRGHGASDAPKQDYTMAGFADDLRLDLCSAQS